MPKTWKNWKRKRAKVIKRDMAKEVSKEDLKYPLRTFSEFEVQAYVYWKIKEMGFDVRGEVRAGIKSRLDLVIFDEKKSPLRVIEIKATRMRTNVKSPFARRALGRMATQMDRYKLYGVPVDLVRGMNDAIDYIAQFQIDGPFYGTKPLSEVVESEVA